MNTFQQYFRLQLSIIIRQLKDFGIKPILGIILILSGFYGLSFYLFIKSEYANYMYVLLALSTVFKYGETNRNDFLKFNYPKNTYLKIRLLENLIAISPFLIFLSFKQDFCSIIILVLFASLLSLINIKINNTAVLPTPFYKKPFEFIIGIRKCIGIFLLLYVLTTVSVIYSNFNLGIFSLILAFIFCHTFYTDTENVFYVWIHKFKARAFLIHKIKIAILFSTVLCLPLIVALLIYFNTNFIVIIGVLALGYCSMVIVILGKYSNYPQKMSLPNGFMMGIAIVFPPLLLVLMPFFYNKSIKQLKEILE